MAGQQIGHQTELCRDEGQDGVDGWEPCRKGCQAVGTRAGGGERYCRCCVALRSTDLRGTWKLKQSEDGLFLLSFPKAPPACQALHLQDCLCLEGMPFSDLHRGPLQTGCGSVPEVVYGRQKKRRTKAGWVLGKTGAGHGQQRLHPHPPPSL